MFFRSLLSGLAGVFGFGGIVADPLDGLRNQLSTTQSTYQQVTDQSSLLFAQATSQALKDLFNDIKAQTRASADAMNLQNTMIWDSLANVNLFSGFVGVLVLLILLYILSG